MDTEHFEEDEKMKKCKCRLCGKKATFIHKGLCFDCSLAIGTMIAEARESTCNEQEKINEGLFQLIQLQQDTIDELVKHIDNEAITQVVATRREIYERCRGAVIRDTYRRWKEGL